MAAENQASGVPPVQYVRVSNIGWFDAKPYVEYDRDPGTGNFGKRKEFGYLRKDNSAFLDLSTLDNIKPLDVIRVGVDVVAGYGKTGDAIRYNPNKQTATYQMSGTTLINWFEKS
jgi:hypothetical protein